jgi:hypothetical protein
MRRIDDETILVALCCGRKCERGKNTGLCHRWDFVNEARRIKVMLNDWLTQSKESEPL